MAKRMSDHAELLESALNTLPEGMALLNRESKLVFWSQSAEAITGFARAELLQQPLPAALAGLATNPPPAAAAASARGLLVQVRHKLEHEIPAITRCCVLHDELGEPIGTAIHFHPADRLDALPHGACSGEEELQETQDEFEERLRAEFEDFENGGEPLGVLWIGIDQGADLRRTHGMGAFRSMLDKMKRSLALGLRPADELARWGDDEFLIIAHERTPQMLAAHGRVLAGLARTTDFRWWGDRISLTVSIGAAQARREQTLAELLRHARESMQTAMLEGGNRVTLAHHESALGSEA